MLKIRHCKIKPSIQPTSRTKTIFRTLLRRMLREATYLPDPVARKYHHNYILGRFREYNPKEQDSPPPWRESPKRIRDATHQMQLLRKCQEYLLQLYKAGNGDLKILRTVLLKAYGRVGPKKHELLKPYLLPEVPANPTSLEEAMEEKNGRKLLFSSAMRSLINAQGQQIYNSVGKQRGNMRRFFRDVLPEKDIWGRPMPVKRIANKKPKEMNALVEKLYPPLPQEQFKRLQDLAAGRIRCSPVPRRKAPAGSELKLPGVGERHKLDGRRMRRLWTTVLTLSSTAEKRDDKTYVTWGTPSSIDVSKYRAMQHEQALFAKTVQP